MPLNDQIAIISANSVATSTVPLGRRLLPSAKSSRPGLFRASRFFFKQCGSLDLRYTRFARWVEVKTLSGTSRLLHFSPLLQAGKVFAATGSFQRRNVLYVPVWNFTRRDKVARPLLPWTGTCSFLFHNCVLRELWIRGRVKNEEWWKMFAVGALRNIQK